MRAFGEKYGNWIGSPRFFEALAIVNQMSTIQREIPLCVSEWNAHKEKYLGETHNDLRDILPTRLSYDKYKYGVQG